MALRRDVAGIRSLALLDREFRVCAECVRLALQNELGICTEIDQRWNAANSVWGKALPARKARLACFFWQDQETARASRVARQSSCLLRHGA